MYKHLLATVAAAAIATASTAAGAKTCHDEYSAWKQQALKDGKLLSTIHTGKRAAIFRKGSTEMRGKLAGIKGDDPACRKFLAWLAAESQKTQKMVPADRRAAYTAGDKTSPVQASGLAKSTNKADFMDRPLYDQKGMYVGTVDDVIFVNGQPRYIAVSRSNFMGSTDEIYVLPLSAARVTANNDAFVIGTSRDTFYRDYPKYAYADWGKTRAMAEKDAKFQKDLDDRYKGISTFGQ